MKPRSWTSNCRASSCSPSNRKKRDRGLLSTLRCLPRLAASSSISAQRVGNFEGDTTLETRFRFVAQSVVRIKENSSEMEQAEHGQEGEDISPLTAADSSTMGYQLYNPPDG